jgi:hypothetical protein
MGSEHETKETLIFDRVEDDGSLTSYFHISTACDDDLFYHNAFCDFISNEEDPEVIIRITFSVYDVLGSLIESNEFGLSGHTKIDINSKPSFDALRCQCLKMIDKLDRLEFA